MAGRQITLAIIKPDLYAHPVRTQLVLSILQEHLFTIRHSAELRLARKDAELFYEEHKGKFFFNRLTGFMSSGPLMAMILEREDAIRYWRLMLGPTHPSKARHVSPNSFRAQFGMSDTRNCLHGSDSVESALKEIKFFFPSISTEELLTSLHGASAPRIV